MKIVTVRIGARGRPGTDGASNWTEITGKPATFPPSSHTHVIGDTTGLQTALDGKAAVAHTHAQGDVTGLTSALAGKAPATHTHAQSDVTGLVSALEGKASTSHTHVIADTTGLQAALDGKAAASHTHAQSDVTGLVSALAGKAATVHTHVIGDTTGLQAALDGKAASSHTHGQGDITGLASSLAEKADLVGGVIPTAQIPAIAITEFLGTVASQAAMLALTGQRGDWCNRSDVSKAYVLTAEPASTLGNWAAIDYPAAPVLSVNNQTGTVVIGKSDVGLANVDNTSDANKPISLATQTALYGKAASSHTHANATGSTAGFMSAADKSKLDGVAANANNYTLPAPGTTTLGGVKRNTGSNGQFVSGIDANGNLQYGTPAGGGADLQYRSATLQAYMDAGSPATSAPSFEGTILDNQLISLVFHINGLSTDQWHFAQNDPELGGTWYNTSGFSTAMVASAISAELSSWVSANGFNSTVTVTSSGDTFTITTSVIGASSQLSATCINGNVTAINFNGGGYGSDEVPPSGAIQDVLLAEAVTGKRIGVVRLLGSNFISPPPTMQLLLLANGLNTFIANFTPPNSDGSAFEIMPDLAAIGAFLNGLIANEELRVAFAPDQSLPFDGTQFTAAALVRYC